MGEAADAEADAFEELAAEESDGRWARFAMRCDAFDPVRARFVRLQRALHDTWTRGEARTKEEEDAARAPVADVQRWLGPLASLTRPPKLEFTIPKLSSDIGDHVDRGGGEAAATAAIAASPALLLVRSFSPSPRQSTYGVREAETLAASRYVTRIESLGLDDVAVSPEALTTLLDAPRFERLTRLGLYGGSSIDGMSGLEMFWPTIETDVIRALVGCAGALRLTTLGLRNQALADDAAELLLASPNLANVRGLDIEGGNVISEPVMTALRSRFGDVT